MDVIWFSEFLTIPRVLFACVLLTFSDLAVLMRLFLENQDKERDPGGNNQRRADSPMFDVTSKCCRGAGAGRTFDFLGQGSGVYAPTHTIPLLLLRTCVARVNIIT